MSNEEHAFSYDAMPVNSLPFLRRIEEILDENQTNNPSGLPESEKHKVRACLWILNNQFYGQLFKIDSSDEFDLLSNLKEKGEL